MLLKARELDHHERTMELSKTMESGGKRAAGADKADSSGSGDPRKMGKRRVKKFLLALYPKSTANGRSDCHHRRHHGCDASVL